MEDKRTRLERAKADMIVDVCEDLRAGKPVQARIWRLRSLLSRDLDSTFRREMLAFTASLLALLAAGCA